MKKAPLQAKHKSPYRLLIDESDQQPSTLTIDTMKSGPHYKTPNTGSYSAQCQFVIPFLVQCAKCSGQHTVWSGWCTQLGRSICGQQNILKSHLYPANALCPLLPVLGYSVQKAKKECGVKYEIHSN